MLTQKDELAVAKTHHDTESLNLRPFSTIDEQSRYKWFQDLYCIVQGFTVQAANSATVIKKTSLNISDLRSLTNNNCGR